MEEIEKEVVETPVEEVKVEESANTAETTLTPPEGKPVGMATIVEDAPIDQFPAHDENISSQ